MGAVDSPQRRDDLFAGGVERARVLSQGQIVRARSSRLVAERVEFLPNGDAADLMEEPIVRVVE